MTKWTNFNDARDQVSYELIPHKTIAKVRLLLKKGNHVTKEWPDGYATKSKSATCVYLACEFVVLSGQYENRKIWSNIGLHSDKSTLYAEIGRDTIRAILNSARGLHYKDKSPEAEKLRTIRSFADLDNLICVAEITINDKGDKPCNEIKTIITPDHIEYIEFMEENSSKLPTGLANSKQSAGELISDEIPF